MSEAKKQKQEEKVEVGLNFEAVDIDDEKKGKLLYELKNDFYCYWDESYGMPKDPKKDYIFKPALALWKSGIVHSEDHFADLTVEKVESDKNLKEDFDKLLELKNVVKGKRLGSESEYPFFPIIIKYSGSSITSEEVLSALGAHEEVKSEVSDKTLKEDQDEREKEEEQDKEEEEEGDDEKKQAKKKEKEEASENLTKIIKWFDETFSDGERVEFAAGRDKCNPVVWLGVGKGKSGNLIGLLSGLVWT